MMGDQVTRILLKIEENCHLYGEIFNTAVVKINNFHLFYTSRLQMLASCNNHLEQKGEHWYCLSSV